MGGYSIYIIRNDYIFPTPALWNMYDVGLISNRSHPLMELIKNHKEVI